MGLVPLEEMTNDNPAYDSLEYWAKKLVERVEELEYLNDNEFNTELLYLIGVSYPDSKILAPYLDHEGRETIIKTITKESKRKPGGYNG